MSITIENKTIIQLPQAMEHDHCYANNSVPLRDYHTDPVSEACIRESVISALKQAGSPYNKLGETYFAVGIQSYQQVDGKFSATGPLADLYPVNQRYFSHPDELTKVGFHNQNMKKPSWEIHLNGEEIELLAVSAEKIQGASVQDVPWLYVELEDNQWGIKGIVRSHTRGGLAPSETTLTDLSRVGVGYMTLYTLITC